MPPRKDYGGVILDSHNHEAPWDEVTTDEVVASEEIAGARGAWRVTGGPLFGARAA